MARPNQNVGADESTLTPPPVEPEKPEVATPPTAPVAPTMSPDIAALLEVIRVERENRDRQHDELIATINAQNEDIQGLQAELNAVADKGRLANWEEKALGKTTEKVVKLRSYSGKVVVGWSAMKTNLVYKNSQGAIIEDQTTELVYADQSREIVKYDAWAANASPVVCTLKSSRTLSTGETIYELEDAAGNKYNVQDVFVN